MIVTTCLRPDNSIIDRAIGVAKDLDTTFEKRNDLSIAEMHNVFNSPILVVGKKRLELFTQHSNEPFFFHPNSAVFRIRRLLNGEHDPFCDACSLEEGDSLLDCTLGLASDSIVASFRVGEKGRVIGLEKNKTIAYIVKEGIKTDQQNIENWNEILNRIEVNHVDHLAFLKKQKDNSIDVIYFDPMFQEEINESNGIKKIKPLAEYDSILEETIEEAKRVASKKVVLKDHFRSDRFKKYGFHQLIRKSAQFHFGYIEL
ncbi:class I SAM-dependent methyltransferase [Bacillus sp. RG28]|uniref:Class I SAM-dependent methyltransferase n=1 Tax=Gottfriedia endophytica TaxID=2820819 RepID=A0A940NNR0_9BACI|nr:class I SAM-dependent methyltransferase [Gottfriedia endophytica]MBP0724091.1 class I SAM-dependent methyltransferase [Gottfriedia endophytica]